MPWCRARSPAPVPRPVLVQARSAQRSRLLPSTDQTTPAVQSFACCAAPSCDAMRRGSTLQSASLVNQKRFPWVTIGRAGGLVLSVGSFTLSSEPGGFDCSHGAALEHCNARQRHSTTRQFTDSKSSCEHWQSPCPTSQRGRAVALRDYC